MRKTIASILIAVSAALSSPGSPASASTLDVVKDRGTLVCGVNGNRAGFSSLDSKGKWVGLDVDTCRAIAAAILGDANKVAFVKTTSQTRFTALQTGEIDVLARNTTWTLSRDTELGFDFVAPTFYDGQGFMVPKSLGVETVKDLNGATVCIAPGSTAEIVATDVFRQNKLDFKPVVIDSVKEINTAFFSGRCDVQVLTTSGLSAARATVAPNPDEYVILSQVFSKDPMGPVVRQDDPVFRDIVAWSVYAMMQAEESGVSSENIDSLLESNDVTISRLVGKKGNLGEALGLDPQWSYRIVKQVGNYAEVFDRHLGKDSPLKLERGLNDLWSRGGLLYAPPFK